MTINSIPHVIDDKGVARTCDDVEPTVAVELTLQQLRVNAKSLGRTRDVELRKLGRLKRGTEVHEQVSADYELLDSVAAAVDTAISQLVRPAS